MRPRHVLEVIDERIVHRCAAEGANNRYGLSCSEGEASGCDIPHQFFQHRSGVPHRIGCLHRKLQKLDINVGFVPGKGLLFIPNPLGASERVAISSRTVPLASPAPLAEGHLDSFQNYIVDFDTFSERYLAQRLMRCHGEVDGGMNYPRSRLPPFWLRRTAGGSGRGSATLRHKNAPGGFPRAA